MNFQDQVENDLDEVFFNFEAKEFTTKHRISDIPGKTGKEYWAIVDNDTLLERKIKDDVENIFLGDILFFMKKADLGHVPRVEDIMFFDEKQYIIGHVNDDFGVLEITLISNNG